MAIVRQRRMVSPSWLAPLTSGIVGTHRANRNGTMTHKWQDGAVKEQQETAGIEITVAKWQLLWWDSAQLLACFNMLVKNMAVIGNYTLFNIQLLIPTSIWTVFVWKPGWWKSTQSLSLLLTCNCSSGLNTNWQWPLTPPPRCLFIYGIKQDMS